MNLFFLHTTWSIKETLYTLIFWSELETYSLPCPYQQSILFHIYAGSLILCEAQQCWSHVEAHRPLSSCKRSASRWTLGSFMLKALVPRKPWEPWQLVTRIRHKLWNGPERASCTKASLHPSSYWLIWEKALISLVIFIKSANWAKFSRIRWF